MLNQSDHARGEAGIIAGPFQVVITTLYLSQGVALPNRQLSGGRAGVGHAHVGVKIADSAHSLQLIFA